MFALPKASRSFSVISSPFDVMGARMSIVRRFMPVSSHSITPTLVVSLPESSVESMPMLSPWQSNFSMSQSTATVSASSSGSFSSFISCTAARKAFLPCSGVDACAAMPVITTFAPLSAALTLYVKSALLSFATAAFTSSALTGTKTSALPGTALDTVPAFTRTEEAYSLR